MHALPALFPQPGGGTVPVPRAWVETADWAVLFTLGTLLFLLGAFAMWAWLIWRRTTRPAPHVKLLMELEEEQAAAERAARAAMPPAAPAPRPAWEQSPDWWKQADS